MAALLVAAPALAQDEVAALARASERGRAIYAYDRAAWIGTDDMVAKLPDYEARVAGYVVEGPVAEPRLIFFDKAATPQAIYVARFANGKLVESKVLGVSDNRTIAPETRRMIAARSTAANTIAAASDVRPCEAKRFNTVVLPPAAREGRFRSTSSRHRSRMTAFRSADTSRSTYHLTGLPDRSAASPIPAFPCR